MGNGIGRLMLAAVLAVGVFGAPEGGQDEVPTSPLVEDFPLLSGRVLVQGPRGEDLAAIDLPDRWGYFATQQARTVVEEWWGNPQYPDLVGLVVPPGWNSDGGPAWAIMVSYAELGLVVDAGASEIDFSRLLLEMQADEGPRIQARREAGLASSVLQGWAEAPHYDSRTKQLTWAKSVLFDGEEAPTLNYEVRLLGRKGVLGLNAVGAESEFDALAAGSKLVLQGTRFLEGQRYGDFDQESGDAFAGHGLDVLISGLAAPEAGPLRRLGLFFNRNAALLLAGALVVFAGLLWRSRRSD